MVKPMKCIRVLVLLTLVVFVTQPCVSKARAQSANRFTASLPFPVQMFLSGYVGECKQLGGHLIGDTTPKILTADIDGDGKPDYIFNPENLRCSESASLFCHNAGCAIKIIVSTDGYLKPIDILGAPPVLKPRRGGTDVEVTVQNPHCKTAFAPNTCVAVFSWQRGRGEVGYETRKPR
jgi:hypothetical protein